MGQGGFHEKTLSVTSSYSMPQLFVSRGEQKMQSRARPGKKGLRAFHDLIESLEAGHTPADTLYRLAGLEPPNAKVKPKAKHFDDLLDEHIANKQSAEKERVRGLEKAKAASPNKIKVPRTRDTGVYVPRRSTRSYPGGGVAAAGNELVTIYADLWYRQRQLRQQRRDILAVGRRGAGATRVFQPSAAGRTNRTGAKSTRAVTASAPAPVIQRSNAGAKSAARTGTVVRSAQTTGASASDTRARQVMSSSSKMPTAAKTQSTQRNIWEKLLNQATGSLSSSLSGKRSTSTTRQGSVLRVSRSPMSSPASRAKSQSTTMQTQGQQQSAGSSDPRCKCPPKEKKRYSEPRCTNPIVSKTEKDGFLITKRKIECQPSKPK